jgi:hypothetical protein
MVTCAFVAPGKLRDHRADIKHSLVDRIQLPHMPKVVRWPGPMVMRRSESACIAVALHRPTAAAENWRGQIANSERSAARAVKHVAARRSGFRARLISLEFSGSQVSRVGAHGVNRV